MRAFHLRSGDGEEEAGGSCVVKRGCENLKGSGEGAALGASGGEEAASDSWGSGAKGDVTRGEVSIRQSKAEVNRMRKGEVVLRRV
jgi:hypothetical protein